MTTAVLVLDMLDDFVSGKLANPPAEQVIEQIVALTGAARSREDWLVIYGSDAHQPRDLELAVFGEHAMAGSPGARVVKPLTSVEGDVVVPKRFYSAFSDTDLDATCRVRGVDRLVLTGQHTECCCRHTSYDAFARGIKLIAVADATAAYEPFAGASYDQVQRHALEYLRTYYGAEITATADLV